MSSPKTYLFFGNVGAGKGTQVALLKEDLKRRDNANVVYAYPGNEFRQFVSEKGYSNVLAKEILDRGNLLPLFLVATMFAHVTTRELQSSDDHLIIDGFPRSLEQVPVFESAMTFYGRKNIEIIYLNISKAEAIKRLKDRGRHDDTDEGIANRFEEYEKNVVPALNLLKEKGYKIYTIEGEKHIDEVHIDIKKVLEL
jgi:adenylate kinase family enzyme